MRPGAWASGSLWARKPLAPRRRHSIASQPCRFVRGRGTIAAKIFSADTDMANAPLSAHEQITLAERIRKGDASAQEEFAVLFSQKVFVMMLARTRDPEAARELVQEVLMAALRALLNGRVRETDKLAAFVHGTARNLVNNYLRARQQQPSQEPISLDIALVEPIDAFETVERLTLVRKIIQRLEPMERKILLLTLVEGLKPGEIAQQLGLGPELVRQRKSRALKKLIDRVRKMSRK